MAEVNKNNVTIRVAKPSDIEGFMEMGKKEGWNMGIHDIPTNYKDYPEGWFIAEESSVPLGRLYCVKYPSGVGHIGYLIVEEAHRGKGVGTKLLNHAMEYLLAPGVTSDSNDRLLSLYTAEEEFPFYKKLGFSIERKLTRLILDVNEFSKDSMPAELGVLNPDFTTSFINPAQDLDAICSFDASLSGAYRREFWSLYGKTLANKNCVVCKSKDGKIVGVGAIRPFLETWKTAPIYAENELIAQEIMTLLLTCNIDVVKKEEFRSKITLDIIDTNKPALDLFTRMGFTKKSDSYLMVKSDLLKNQIHPSCQNEGKIYSVASLDFN